MKTTTKSRSPGLALFSVRRLLPALMLLVSPRLFAGEPPSGTAEPKTHTLFMGADILVEQNKGFYPVQDVVGGSFVIKVEGKEVKVPADWGAVKLKVNRSLKLTATSVSIARLKVDRAYTPGNDPVKKFMSQQGGMQAREDTVANLSSRLDTATMMDSLAKAAPGGTGVRFGEDPATIRASLNREQSSVFADYDNQNTMIGNMVEAKAEQLFDAMDVEFEVSSEKLIRKPYVAIMAQYHEKGSKPGESHFWLYAAALEPLDAKPQKVRIRKGGFPPGFELENYQVRVYDGGTELATSVSEKQVPLTRTEAFTYLLLDYVASHKGATLPAAPALGRLSPEEKGRLSSEQLKQTYYVKVTKDGLPVAAFADADCARPVDDVVGSLVGSVRFYPALEKGKTTEGVAELRFSRLAL